MKESKYGFSKSYVIAKYCLQLIISKDVPPPSHLDPDNIDFLVHIKYDGDCLDDEALSILEKASAVIQRKSERDPDGETDKYKIRIDTSKAFPNSNVYIRDEKKDIMPFMTINGILFRLLTEIVNELEELDRENGDEQKDSEEISQYEED